MNGSTNLQRNGYRIIQNPERFCFGMDAVLLSGFAQVKEQENAVVDLGTGTGIIPILLEAKTEGKAFYRTGDPAGECGYGRHAASALNELQDRVRHRKRRYQGGSQIVRSMLLLMW